MGSLEVLAAVVALIGSLIAVTAGLRREILPPLRKIAEEFKPNGGKTLVDKLNRIEEQQLSMERRLRVDLHTIWNVLDGEGDVGIWRADPTGLFTEISDTCLAILGLTHREAIGHGWKNGVHPDDFATVEAQFRAAVSDQRIFVASFRLRHRDGSVIPVHVRQIPVVFHGELTAYVGRMHRMES